MYDLGPKMTVDYIDQKTKDFLFTTMDMQVEALETSIDYFDRLSGRIFTTYTSRTKNLVNGYVEHAKEVIRSGNIKPKV